MRSPRRIVKGVKQADINIIHRPAEANKPKTRLYRAQYLESGIAKTRPSSAGITQPTESASTKSEGSITWRNLHPETDGPIIDVMRSLTSGRRNRNREEILLEGRRLIQDAIACGVEVRNIVFCDPKVLYNFPVSPSMELIRISQHRMNTWSLLDTPPGIMGDVSFKSPLIKVESKSNGFIPVVLARKKVTLRAFGTDLVPSSVSLAKAFAKLTEDGTRAISEAQASETIPLVVVCDGIKDPSNMGSLIRSLASAGCKAVLTLAGCCDPWQVKVLRAASGGHFYLPIYEHLRLPDIRSYLPSEFTLLLADANLSYDSCPKEEARAEMSNIHWSSDIRVSSEMPVVLFIGSESTGLSQATVHLAAELKGNRLHIPMARKGMCLSSSVAAAVVAFEIRRQFLEKSSQVNL